MIRGFGFGLFGFVRDVRSGATVPVYVSGLGSGPLIVLPCFTLRNYVPVIMYYYRYRGLGFRVFITITLNPKP